MRFPASARALVRAAALGLVLMLLAPSLGAQYFGRNKVQYQRFAFKVMKTRHFDVYFYLHDEETVRQAGMMAERWYARLARMFNHELKGRQPLILYASGPDFQQTTVIAGEMGEGTGGVTESFKRRIALPYGVTLEETDHVIGHELVHAFQYDLMAQGHSDDARVTQAQVRIPLWFIEGMAEYLSIGPADPLTAMWMRDTVRRKDLPTIPKLNNTYKYFPYRYGHSVWAYLTGRWGDEIIGKMMKAVGRAGDYEAILETMTGVKMKQLAADWHKAMQEAYGPLVEKTKTADAYGRVLFKGTEENPYNISPVLSPDGKEIVFFSTRDLLSIDLFLADAETGKIKRKLVSTAIDPHFESIQFIRSAGSWSPDGGKFVFGAIRKGKPSLTVIDMKKDRIEREYEFRELDEILNPAWSPGGKSIAFSAMAGGLSDIFLYDLETNVLRQLTRDVYSDLHPAWSPDGKTLAFVTDRFNTNLQWLDIGVYELALLDPESGEPRRLLAFPAASNLNPQWSPDGRSLYFLSDQGGKVDLYRLEIEGSKIYEITNLYTGISGITELSPSMSVAHDTGRLSLAVYENDGHSIYVIDKPEVLAGQAFLTQLGTDVAVLPPRKQTDGALIGLLKNPLFGLPKDTNFVVSDYKPKMTLDYIAPPTVAVGVDRYGTYGSGGIAAYWSDMLGTRTFVTSGGTSTYLIDTSALVGYINSSRRLNWGAVAQRTPYIVGYGYDFYVGDIAGQPAYIEQEEIIRQINWELQGFASYPLSRVQRVEFGVGARFLQFNDTMYTRAYDLYTEMLIYNDRESVAIADNMALGFATASLVYDTGIFGATSPIMGQSYVLSAQPSFGSITYTNVQAEYRRYFMPLRPFTLAFRALHYGRYGSGADDERLWPIYIGYWDLVRGYDYNSFSYEEFTDSGFNFYRLYGNKMFLANFELRFPLFGVLGLGKGFYGVWPLEAYAFYDFGTAWTNSDKTSLLGGPLKPVSSAGVGLRTNVFGFLVLGINYVYPFDRPNKGWHWQFSFSPGF